jgi:hypothetical protein
MFTRPSIAELTVFSASEGKYWDGCQNLKKESVLPTHAFLVPSKRR